MECGGSERVWSADELRSQARDLRSRLETAGVEPGARVALLLPNHAAYPVALMAILSLSATPVLLSPDTPGPPLVRSAHEHRIQWVLRPNPAEEVRAPEGLAEGLRVAPCGLSLRLSKVVGASAPSKPFSGVLHPTSGTYGRSAFCLRNQTVAVAEARNFVATIPVYRRARVTVTTPLGHAYAYGFGLVASLITQSTLVTDTHFNPKRLLAREAQQPSDLLALVPPMVGLLPAVGRLMKTRAMAPRVFFAGAPCRSEDRQNFEHTFDSKLYAIYGTTESGGVSTNFRESGPPGEGVGRPLANVRVAIRRPERYRGLGPGVGEVHVNSPSLMQGYLEGAAARDPDGFFKCGDLGRFTEAGDLVLVGRVKDMINLGGHKVDPAPVEAVLIAHPQVADAAVYPGLLPDGTEIVQAAIQVRVGAVDMDALRRHCAARLAPRQVPLRLHRVSALPRTASGKCLKVECPEFPAELRGR